MSDYHPNLDGPAEPIGLAMGTEQGQPQSELASAPGSAAAILVTPPIWSEPREVPCPDCYGGHFRPCNICGDSGVALFSERLEQPNDKLTDPNERR